MKRNSFDYQFILVLRAKDGRSLGAFPTLHKRAAALRTAQSALQLRDDAAMLRCIHTRLISNWARAQALWNWSTEKRQRNKMSKMRKHLFP